MYFCELRLTEKKQKLSYVSYQILLINRTLARFIYPVRISKIS